MHRINLMQAQGTPPLLQEKKLYTFVGFSIGGDKEKLKLSGLEINPDKYVDMQRKRNSTVCVQ